jgi:hypothetical protein
MQGTSENEPDLEPIAAVEEPGSDETPQVLVDNTSADLVRVHKCLAEAAAAAIACSIYGARADRRIRGRVDEVRSGTTNWFMTLGVDVEGVNASFTASVPQAKVLDRPVVGSVVELKGRFVARGVERRLSVGVEFSAWQCTVIRYPAARETPKTIRVMVSRPFHRVGLVTARESAGDVDFAQVLKESGLGDLIEIVPEYIRLESGPIEAIAASIRSFASKDVGLVVVTRGGGPKAMLRRFGDPLVVRAIADLAAQKPVMVAIGHANDWVRAEAFASYTALTPSDAAHQVARLYRQAFEDARLARRRRLRRLVTRVVLIATAALAVLWGARWVLGRIFDVAAKLTAPAAVEAPRPPRFGPPRAAARPARGMNRDPGQGSVRAPRGQRAPAGETTGR